MSIDSEQLSTRQKLQALRRVAEYRPVFTAGLVTLGAFVAFLEGVGLGFIYPIIETAQSEDPTSVSGPVMEAFISAYEFFGIPFSLGYLIVGVAIVMTVRYTMSFIVQWFAVVLANQYEKHLRTQAFQNALNAEIEYYDAEGTDDILNAIITETRYSGTVIEKGVRLMEILFLTSMYLSVMLYTAPSMTVIAVALLGGITVLLRFVIEPAVNAGSRVAEANERVQQSVQAGTQGIRDVKLFGLQNEVFSTFSDAIEQYANSEIDLGRNDAGIRNAFELSAAITIFVLIYVGFTFTGLALGELGIFLIAMFQLAPRVSSLNGVYYKVEGNLTHVVRTFSFL
jgi:subfamily B ATP-binding cassette protein MsbA